MAVGDKQWLGRVVVCENHLIDSPLKQACYINHAIEPRCFTLWLGSLFLHADGWGALSRLDAKVASRGGFGLDVLQGLRSRLVYEALLYGWGGRMVDVVSLMVVLSRWLHVVTCKRHFHSVGFCAFGGKFHAPYSGSNGGMIVYSYHPWWATIVQ
jgi:hypothetical protein